MGSILEIVAKLLGLTDFLIRRKAAKNDDPQNRVVKLKQENEQAIVDGTAGSRTVDLLNRLPDGENKGAGPVS